MRGRTNIVQRLGAYVNGNEEQFTVADGETISAGDFVELEYKSQVSKLSSSTMLNTSGGDLNKLIYLDDSTFLFCRVLTGAASILEISSIRISGDSLLSLSSLSFTNIENGSNDVILLDNNFVAVALYNRLHLLSCNNGTLTLIDTYDYDIVVSDNISSLQKLSNSRFLLNISFEQCYIFNYSTDGLTLVKTEVLSLTYFIQHSDIQAYYIGKIASIDSGLVLAFLGALPSSGIAVLNNIHFLFVKVDDSNNITFIETVRQSGSLSIKGPGLFAYPRGLNSNDCLLQFSNNSTGYTTAAYYNINVIRVNEEENDIQSLLTNFYIGNFDGVNKAVAGYPKWSISVLKENLFICSTPLYSGNYSNVVIGIFQFDSNAITVSCLSSVILDTSSVAEDIYNGLFYCKENGNDLDIYYVFNNELTSEIDWVKLIYSGGILVLGERTNKVKKYKGGGAIGFAKSGGSSGQQVTIYTPKI